MCPLKDHPSRQDLSRPVVSDCGLTNPDASPGAHASDHGVCFFRTPCTCRTINESGRPNLVAEAEWGRLSRLASFCAPNSRLGARMSCCHASSTGSNAAVLPIALYVAMPRSTYEQLKLIAFWCRRTEATFESKVATNLYRLYVGNARLGYQFSFVSSMIVWPPAATLLETWMFQLFCTTSGSRCEGLRQGGTVMSRRVLLNKKVD